MNPMERSDVLWVGMNQVAKTKYDSNIYKIGTSGLATCTGIAIYNPEEREGSVAHVWYQSHMTIPMFDRRFNIIRHSTIENSNMYEHFRLLFNQAIDLVKGQSGTPLEVTLVNLMDEEKLRKVVNSSVERNKELGLIDKISYGYGSQLILDTKNGSVTTSF